MLILFARDIWASNICTRWLTGSDWLSHGQEGSDTVAAAPTRPTPEEPAALAAKAVSGSVSASANAADAAIRRMRRRSTPEIGFITASDSSYQRDHARAIARNGPGPVAQCSPTITTPARRGSLAAGTGADSALLVAR